MLVRVVTTNAKTREVTEEWVESPDTLTVEQGQAVAAVVAQQEANAKTIEQQADQALASNAAFLAIASPTNAQTLAQVKALTRQNNKIIRLLLRKFDGTD